MFDKRSGGPRASLARGLVAWAGCVGLLAMAAAGVGLARLLTPTSPAVVAGPGVPVLREVHLGAQHVPVLLTPQRPGRNLVLIGAELDGVRVGADPATVVTATGRPGADGRWAAVDLPPGRGVLWLEQDGQRVTMPVDTGTGEPAAPEVTGTDGPECATAILGGLLNGAPNGAPNAVRPQSGCPSGALTPADEASLRDLVAFLAGRGVRTVALATDAPDAPGSPRSVAAAAAVRDAAARNHLVVTADLAASRGPDGAVLVVSGWTAAQTTLARLAGAAGVTGFGYGTYLAPWLLTAPLLRTAAGAVVPLRFDPRDDQPVRYRLALAARFHGQHPTAAGYQGWLAAGGGAESGATRLYAASAVAFLPAELAAGHQHDDGGWLPGGTVVAVTGALGNR